MTDWISVKDRLPEHDGLCLVCGPNGRLLAKWNSYYRRWDDNESVMDWYDAIGQFTHWMPLPEPPKEEV